MGPLVAVAAVAAAKTIGDMINSGRSLPTADLTALYQQIDQAGEYKRDLINQLPEELKKGYDTYSASLQQAGEGLTASNAAIGQGLLQDTKALYGPDSDVVKATLAGLKTQDYSTLPGTVTNLKAQLSASGGLSRGGAAKAITQAVMAPATEYAGQAQKVMSQQLQAGQEATQAAINKVASIDETTAQEVFGMSKQQATTILQYGREDLKDQLASLVNEANTTLNAKLGLGGYQANQAYQNAVTRGTQQGQIVNDVAGGVGALVSGLASTNSPSTTNALANQPKPVMQYYDSSGVKSA